MFDCPLNVFKCILSGWMPDEIWSELNSKYKKCFMYTKNSKMVEDIFRDLILKQNQSADLKTTVGN